MVRRLSVVLDRLDELPRGAWVALIVFGFWFWWPAGLAALGYLAFGRHRHGWPQGWRGGRWYNAPPQNGQAAGQNVWGCRSRRAAAPAPSGNKAFDEYRSETLKRLEEEQQEFVAYLDRLRQARDKSEFEAFMADRRQPKAPPTDVAN